MRDLTTNQFTIRKAMWLLKKHGAGGGTRTRTELSLQRILSLCVCHFTTPALLANLLTNKGVLKRSPRFPWDLACQRAYFLPTFPVGRKRG